MDWAEKAANDLIENSLAEYGATALEIAAALRKAKAEGYCLGFKETALDMAQAVAAVIAGKEFDLDAYGAKVISRASAIEKGME